MQDMAKATPTPSGPSNPSTPSSGYDGLAVLLGALSYPVRLQLLGLLRLPHTLHDIKLGARRGDAGSAPAATAARQTVHAHLRKLEAAQLVRTERIEVGGRAVRQYTVNVQKVYALIEDLRRLSVLYAGQGSGRDITGSLPFEALPPQESGPRLVLTHGVYEGKVFPLAGKDTWVIGRGADAAVLLDYDPFVSVEHARIERREDGFDLVDLGSKNGTLVNWRPMPSQGTRRLKPADIIGVGRSMLVFAEA